MPTTTNAVHGTRIAYRVAGPDAPGPEAFVTDRERDTPRLADAEAAVRVLREHGTRTRLDVLPGRGHGDVLAAREQILASAERFHGPPAGTPAGRR